jgi:uncharacterized protein (DUF952 family)
MIYKILTREEWLSWQASGSYAGSAIDSRDGYIHLSTAAQVLETLRRHFADQHDLLLIGIAPGAIASELLRYEPSRSGGLFPHVYGALALTQVRSVEALAIR